ncbi:hypothetical protein DV736_g2458, partial [Chaetothyriales sp. CBS 134916]
MQAFDDINALTGTAWELRASFGLLLKGNGNGKVHQLEFYVTPEEERSPILPSAISSAKHVLPIWDDPHEIEILRGRLMKDPPQPARLLTRVLDLGVGKDDLDDVRILERPAVGTEAIYAALSHCWLREDAISACRRIGVQYLWIDSLCIVQNVRDDWKREAADMNNVYANAWFAMAMHQSTLGQMPFEDVPLTVDGESTIVHVRRIPELLDIVKGRAAAPAVGKVYEVADNEHWNAVTQRGWCYQERALSQRMIHFTDHEYLYEERGIVRRCQCNWHFGFGLGFAGSLLRLSASEDDTHRAWRTLVQQHTQRMFGRRSDLLPGFAGVARRFGARRDLGCYVAGLWEKDLVKWLCWKSQEWISTRASTWACENCRPHPQRIAWTTENPIPSFSWASRFGPCEFVYESWKLNYCVQVAAVERIECLMDEDNPFLKVRQLTPEQWPDDPCARYLRIHGSLYQCLHFSTRQRGHTFNASMSLCQREYAWAVPDHFVARWDLARNAKDILNDAWKHGTEYCIDAGDDLPLDNSRIYLLRLFEFPEGGKLCLILRPCAEKITQEVLDTVEGWDHPHWMERIGISVFNGSRFDHINEMPHQVIHLM